MLKAMYTLKTESNLFLHILDPEFFFFFLYSSVYGKIGDIVTAALQLEQEAVAKTRVELNKCFS